MKKMTKRLFTFLIAATLTDPSYAINEDGLQRRDSYKKLESLGAEQYNRNEDDALSVFEQKDPVGEEQEGRYHHQEQRLEPYSERIQQSITLDDALSKDAADLQHVTELVIPVERSFTSYSDKLIIAQRGVLINNLLEKMPNVTIVLDCGNKTRIEKNCLSKINAKKIVVRGDKVRVIDDSFLAGCTRLTDLDLTSLKNVAWIRNDFLLGCDHLKKVRIVKDWEFKDNFPLGLQIIEEGGESPNPY